MSPAASPPAVYVRNKRVPDGFFLSEELVPIPGKRTITSGSFGNVEFRQQTGHSSPIVVVKTLRYSGDDQAFKNSERLLAQELTPILAACAHPNIAEFRGLKHLEDSSLGIVIAYAERGSLTSYLNTPYNEIDRSRIVHGIVAGLKYLHTPRPVDGYEKNLIIIHGDLHPGNVLLERDGRAVLTDFGLCKLVALGFPPDLTAASSSGRTGLAPYMAPELHEIIPLPAGSDKEFRYVESRSTRTDIFALGMLIFSIRGGNTATLGPTGYRITTELCKGTRPSLGAVVPKIDGRICKVIEACWHHKPMARPDVAKVHADLAASGVA